MKKLICVIKIKYTILVTKPENLEDASSFYVPKFILKAPQNPLRMSSSFPRTKSCVSLQFNSKSCVTDLGNCVTMS